MWTKTYKNIKIYIYNILYQQIGVYMYETEQSASLWIKPFNLIATKLVSVNLAVPTESAHFTLKVSLEVSVWTTTGA